jgi:chloramphenicol O-acetyltransferase type B
MTILAPFKGIGSLVYYKSRYFHYTAKHPTLSLDFSSKLRSNLSFGDNVSIGKNTLVSDAILGDNVTVHHDCCLIDVSIGDFSYVSTGCWLNFTQIGKFCSLGAQVMSGCGEHPLNFISTNPVFFSTFTQSGVTFAQKDHFEEKKCINIGHDVWIGARTFIKDGIKIGNGAVVAAGAVVVKDVPDYAIVGGVPAKIIRYRFSAEIIEQLLKIEWWNWSIERLRSAQSYFVTEDIRSFIEWVNKHDL